MASLSDRGMQDQLLVGLGKTQAVIALTCWLNPWNFDWNIDHESCDRAYSDRLSSPP